MTPELVHENAGSAAGIHKRLVVSAVIGQIATHVEDIVLLGIFQHTRGTNTALFLRQAHVVTLQQVDVQMQAGGSANNSIVHIGASAAISTIAIVLGQAVQIQFKVRNGDLQICQHTVVGFQRHTVAGNRHINSNRRLVSLVIAVLLLNALVGRIYGQLNGMSDLAALALSGQYQIIGLTLRTLGSGCQVQHAVLQLGKHGVYGAVEGIAVAHLVAVSFCKHIAHFQLIQTAGLCSSCSRRAAFYGQASGGTIHKLNIVCCTVGSGILYRHAVDLAVTVAVLHSDLMAVRGLPAGGTFADVSAVNTIVGPLHFGLKIKGNCFSTLRNGNRIAGQIRKISVPIGPTNNAFLDLGDFLSTHGSHKGHTVYSKTAGGEHSQHHDKHKEQGKKSFLHKRNLLIK